MTTPPETRARVSRLLREILGDPTIAELGPSDVFVAFGSARVGIGVVQDDPREPALVRIWSPLLADIAKTSDLLDVLNGLTGELGVGRFFWTDSVVILETTLLADTLDELKLGAAIKLIGQLADSYDDELARRFGGRLPAA
jgi:hypothetical protein